MPAGDLDRRRFLAGLGVAAVGAALPRSAAAAEDPFAHGVASGDPMPDRVILWTRLTTTAKAAQPLSWVVARDEALTEVVATGTATADPADDWCVHVDATGLPAGTTLNYAFTSGAVRSPVGRTRTAPAAGAAVERVRLAVSSCANHEAGYFNAYARIAERDDLDLVVHLGDYLYETAGAVGPAGRGHHPSRTLRTLADYRTRYAQYRSDPDLQEAHRRHPWAVVWDDHELANNAWRGGARSHVDSRDGSWDDRRAAATRAWRDWQPVRLPDPATPDRIYRSLDFGALARLVLLDTRLIGRDRQETDPAQAARPGRSLLGDVQRTWLEERLAAPGTRWTVLGNQVMLSPHTFGDIPPGAAAQVGADPAAIDRAGDDWTGYPEERRHLVDLIRRLGIDVVVVTGDFHSSWGAQVVIDAAKTSTEQPAAAELVGTSTTSHNLGERLSANTLELANAFVASSNTNVEHVDLGGHGYVLLDLSPARARGEWWVVPTIATRAPGQSLAQAAEVAARRPPPHDPRRPHPQPRPTADERPAHDGGSRRQCDGRRRARLGAAGLGGHASVADRRRRRGCGRARRGCRDHRTPSTTNLTDAHGFGPVVGWVG